MSDIEATGLHDGVGRAAASLDPTVHHPVRLGILTLTSKVQECSFAYLQETLDLTPGNLSRNVSVLEEAGLVESRRGFVGKRARTWVAITVGGRAALAAEQAALRELLG